MLNDFLPLEPKFEAWIASSFESSSNATQEYLKFLASPEDERHPNPDRLWPHQWEALLRVIYAREIEGKSFWERGLLVNIVTGGGKTALMAAVMVWLRLALNINRFLIICPNLIVRDRLEEDFFEGKVLKERDLIPSNSPISAESFALTTLGGSHKKTASDLFGSNVILANIHQFYLNTAAGKRNLWNLLQAEQTPFSIFNDEAHNTPAPEYYRTLQNLQEHPGYRFRLDTTATPNRSDEKPIDSRMIFEYEVPAALRDRIISTPFVYQPDVETVELTYTDTESGETKHVEEIDWEEVDRAGVSATQWVTNTQPMRQQIGIALNRLEEAKRNAMNRYTPILFVVAVSKADARAAKQMLKEQFKLRTLIVTEDEDEKARKEAASIGQSGRYEAVVSVAMLREGWDVPEVSVILLLRKFGSRVYGPQVVGRGLRRIRRADLGSDEPQICAIVDHPKLDHDWLWELLRARVRRKVGLEQQFEEEELQVIPPAQEIIEPELLIEIPELLDNNHGILEPISVEYCNEPIRDWKEKLNAFQYDLTAIEITNQTLSGVTGEELTPEGWTHIKSAPDDFQVLDAPALNRSELAERIRQHLLHIAEQAVITAGYPSHLSGRVYRPLLRHVSDRLLDGQGLSFVDLNCLTRVSRLLPQLEMFVGKRSDIIGGMIEYDN